MRRFQIYPALCGRGLKIRKFLSSSYFSLRTKSHNNKKQQQQQIKSNQITGLLSLLHSED